MNLKKAILMSLLLVNICWSTVNDNYIPQHYIGNGSTVDFAFPWPITDTSDVVVIVRTIATEADDVLTETTDYAISAINNDYSSGGTVTTVATYESTSQITIRRDTPPTQNTGLVVSGSNVLRENSLEDAYDKLTYLIQELQEIVGRCLKIPKTETNKVDLVSITNRADKQITFGAEGDVTVTSVLSTGTANISAWGETLIDDGDAPEARGTLGLDTDDDVEFAGISGTTGTFSGAISGTTGTFSGAISGTIGTFTDLMIDGIWHDIRYYGAIEDGSTDASVAIQAAFDAAEQDAVIDRGRGIVLIPCVTGLGYSCADDIQLKDQILITGGGMIKFIGTYGFESNAKSGWVIDGITIMGSTTTGQVGVYIHNASVKWWIRNCQFYDTEIGIFGTTTYIGRILNNDMYLIGMVDTSCIKLTSGEGNCSKGTAYGTVNDIGIRGNMLKEYGHATSAEPLIWIGDSALAPGTPEDVTHAKSIDISGNELTGKYSAAGVQIENTRMVTIERNWFEQFVGPAINLAGQWHYSSVLRANSIYGNNNDDHMDPAIMIDSTTDWAITSIAIIDNEFNRIHANHNYLEIEDVVGLVINNNQNLTAARIALTTCTGVDIRQPEWNYIFDTFTAADATPTVKFRTLFFTDTGGLTITAFDDPIVGQEIKVVSKGAVVYDTTTANDATHNLDGSSVDITTAAGDISQWYYDGTSWTLMGWVDISQDNSSTAEGIYGN